MKVGTSDVVPLTVSLRRHSAHALRMSYAFVIDASVLLPSSLYALGLDWPPSYCLPPSGSVLPAPIYSTPRMVKWCTLRRRRVWCTTIRRTPSGSSWAMMTTYAVWPCTQIGRRWQPGRWARTLTSLSGTQRRASSCRRSAAGELAGPAVGGNKEGGLRAFILELLSAGMLQRTLS